MLMYVPPFSELSHRRASFWPLQSHPGKVVDRKWYERNKHIFPASRWEVYDPKVERGTYTIHGQEVIKK
jgi:hypothetical protein